MVSTIYFISWPILILALVGAFLLGKNKWGWKGGWLTLAACFGLIVLIIYLNPIILWYLFPLGT